MSTPPTKMMQEKAGGGGSGWWNGSQPRSWRNSWWPTIAPDTGGFHSFLRMKHGQFADLPSYLEPFISDDWQVHAYWWSRLVRRACRSKRL